jgi:hypothetical protein
MPNLSWRGPGLNAAVSTGCGSTCPAACSCRSLGLSFQGRAHNALDDARSMALSMEEMVKRGAVRPAA